MQELRKHRLLLRLLSRCYAHYCQREATAAKFGLMNPRRYIHLLHLTGIEFWSCSHMCQPVIMYLGCGNVRILRMRCLKSGRWSKKSNDWGSRSRSAQHLWELERLSQAQCPNISPIRADLHYRILGGKRRQKSAPSSVWCSPEDAAFRCGLGDREMMQHPHQSDQCLGRLRIFIFSAKQYQYIPN